MQLTMKEREEVAEILKRRANEVATYLGDYMKDQNHFGSVELALRREVDRLRKLQSRVAPPEPDGEELSSDG